jgi:protein disulfide-isomerase A6
MLTIYAEPEDYEGGRSASDIVRWAEDKAAENVPPPEVKQIVDANSVKAACEEHPLCVIAFLPNILDCQVNF